MCVVLGIAFMMLMSISNGAFRARVNISEINAVSKYDPMLEILAHNDESPSATWRQCRHTCVVLIQPRLCLELHSGSSSASKWNTRARISGGRREIGVRAVRRVSRERRSCLVASTSLSTAEMAARRASWS
jgi:hypothetical protein